MMDEARPCCFDGKMWREMCLWRCGREEDTQWAALSDGGGETHRRCFCLNGEFVRPTRVSGSSPSGETLRA